MRPVALVADDDKAVRYVIEVALKREGFEVIGVQDGVECISVAASGAPDVILLDLRMPLVSGVDVLKRRSEWDPSGRIPVFVITGSDDNLEEDPGFGRSVTGVFHKPFDLSMLVSAVTEAASKGRSGGSDVGETSGPTQAV